MAAFASISVAYARLSANMENLTGDCGKNLDEGGFHDNLRFALITMNIIAGAGPPSGE